MKKVEVHKDILFFAFKYAIKRKSYAPKIVMTNIMYNLKELDNLDLKRYIKEIEECKEFGFNNDKELWESLKKEMYRELSFRKHSH